MAIHKRESKKDKKGYVWEVSFYYEDLNGCRKRYTKRGFKSKNEAAMHEAKKKKEFEDGIFIKEEKRTFHDVFYMWLEDNNMKATSKSTRKSIFDRHINEALGNIDIKRLNYETINGFIKKKSNEVSVEVVNKIVAIFNNVFTFAYNNNFVNRKPFDKLSYSKDETVNLSKKETLTFEEFETIIEYFKNPRGDRERLISDNMIIIITLAMYTGLRRGEILGLNREDINFEEMKITVDKQLSYTRGKSFISTTKTSNSNRIIPFPKELVETLKKHFYKYPESDYVIFNSKFERFSLTTFESNIKKCREATGIDFHLHMFRHTFTTQLWCNGVNPKIAQTILGHKNYNTTASVYTNLDSTVLNNVTDNLYN